MNSSINNNHLSLYLMPISATVTTPTLQECFWTTLVLSLAIIIILFFFLKERIECYRSPKKYIEKHIRILYKAIQEKNGRLAFPSFDILMSQIGKRPLQYDDNCNWPQYADCLFEFLKDYKKRTSLERDMPTEEIDNMVGSLAEMLLVPYDTDCLECGARILAEEKQCPKCSWRWDKE